MFDATPKSGTLNVQLMEVKLLGRQCLQWCGRFLSIELPARLATVFGVRTADRHVGRQHMKRTLFGGCIRPGCLRGNNGGSRPAPLYARPHAGTIRQRKAEIQRVVQRLMIRRWHPCRSCQTMMGLGSYAHECHERCSVWLGDAGGPYRVCYWRGRNTP